MERLVQHQGIHVNTSHQAARFVSSQATGLEVQGGGNSQPIASFKDTSASEKVTISSTGNVGIGTTSPGYKLEVNAGNGIFVGDGGAPVLEANSSTGSFKIGDTDELGDGVYLTNDTGGNLANRNFHELFQNSGNKY